jgi:phosphatidylserine/phosphatidylglycerophosphate/cardiolipin synthase-like enzyme
MRLLRRFAPRNDRRGARNDGWRIAVFILTLTILGGGFCFGEEFHPAQVRDISDREYEQAVIELIDNAKESVVLGMYYISTQLETNNPVKLLLNDLVEAEKRGVQVRIYLNTKFPDVSYEELVGEDEFKRLQDAGCEMYFIPQGRRLHDKVVIVDRRYVIDGSMNWSIVALRNNFESATLIDSPGLSEEKIARLEKIYRIQKEKEGKDLGSVPQKEIVKRFHIAERTLEKALADMKKRPPKEK